MSENAKEEPVANRTSKTFPVFDCDSHVVEPPAIWDEYVPAKERAWAKTQFCFHSDADLLLINGRIVPAARWGRPTEPALIHEADYEIVIGPHPPDPPGRLLLETREGTVWSHRR